VPTRGVRVAIAPELGEIEPFIAWNARVSRAIWSSAPRVAAVAAARHGGPRPTGGGSVAASPRILELSWGAVETEAGTFRDAKLWPGGGRGWDWNEAGTDHGRGIQLADVEEVLDHGAEIVVLGRGQQERLQVSDDLLDAIGQRGAEVQVLESTRAVERYNQLADEGRAVGALIHSTC
jgi:hypothetical protein